MASKRDRSRIILSTSDSGAGNLKQAFRDRAVEWFAFALNDGPLPSAASVRDVISKRLQLLEPENSEWARLETHYCQQFSAQREALESDFLAAVSIDLWVDPDSAGQLQLLLLLNWLGCELQMPLNLVAMTVRIGELSPEDLIRVAPSPEAVRTDQIAMARSAWEAYTSPSPAKWRALLEHEMPGSPLLGSAVRTLLRELPDAVSGLMSTQRHILELITAGYSTPHAVIEALHRPDYRTPYGYWRLGELLIGLSRTSEPAFCGLTEEAFDLALHGDNARFKRFKSAPLNLTEFGKALLAGEADFAAHNVIDYWWGGTHITNANLWRWDDAAMALIAPADA